MKFSTSALAAFWLSAAGTFHSVKADINKFTFYGTGQCVDENADRFSLMSGFAGPHTPSTCADNCLGLSTDLATLVGFTVNGSYCDCRFCDPSNFPTVPDGNTGGVRTGQGHVAGTDTAGMDCYTYNDATGICQDPAAAAAAAASPSGGAATGDPHIKTWTGKRFDYMGECDLVFAKSESFGSGQGLEVQIRTTIRNDWSFISVAALQIGNSILEVHANGEYFLDGVKDADLFTTRLADQHRISWQQVRISAGVYFQQFTISIGEGTGKVIIEAKNGLLDVSFENVDFADMGDSVGLMGSFDGKLLGRDGLTTFEDYDQFGQEWQVNLDKEGSLFLSTGSGPQHPAKCNLPTEAKTLEERRMLRGGDDSQFVVEATKACSSAPEDEREACLYDVLATGDLNMAIRGSDVFN